MAGKKRISELKESGAKRKEIRGAKKQVKQTDRMIKKDNKKKIERREDAGKRTAGAKKKLNNLQTQRTVTKLEDKIERREEAGQSTKKAEKKLEAAQGLLDKRIDKQKDAKAKGASPEKQKKAMQTDPVEPAENTKEPSGPPTPPKPPSPQHDVAAKSPTEKQAFQSQDSYKGQFKAKGLDKDKYKLNISQYY